MYYIYLLKITLIEKRRKLKAKSVKHYYAVANAAYGALRSVYDTYRKMHISSLPCLDIIIASHRVRQSLKLITLKLGFRK